MILILGVLPQNYSDDITVPPRIANVMVRSFLALFAEIARRMAVVLKADGCREGWLQGEFYRHFRPQYNGFRVNCSYRGGRVKHDLYCPLPNEMVAELKVYGMRGYFNKNLCGQSNIKRFLPTAAAHA